MANLANAKKGEVVVLKSGKRVMSDGRGGGRVVRKKPSLRDATPAKPTKVNRKPPTRTLPLRPTVGDKLRKRGRDLEKLKRQLRGK